MKETCTNLGQQQALSDELINEFFSKGFIILRGIFFPGEIEKIKQAFDVLYTVSQKLGGESQIYRGSQFVFEKSALHRVVWCGATQRYLLDIGEDHRILAPVATLLKSNKMEQLINQAHFKIPGEAISFPWHQDSQHRGFGTPDWEDVNEKGSYVQTVLAVDHMTPTNGPLSFIPFSCNQGHLGLDQEANIQKFVHEQDAVELHLSSGDLALFGPYTIHSSKINQDVGPRRILINGYAYPGANKKIYPGEGAGRLLFC